MITNKIMLYGILAITIAIMGIGLFVYLTKPTTPPPSETQLPNPASVYCIEQGGKWKIRKDKEGNEQGFCLFEDGSECEEWKFFRGECKKGEKFCKDLCGDGTCQEVVCMVIGCPCSEIPETCPEDCK